MVVSRINIERVLSCITKGRTYRNWVQAPALRYSRIVRLNKTNRPLAECSTINYNRGCAQPTSQTGNVYIMSHLFHHTAFSAVTTDF